MCMKILKKISVTPLAHNGGDIIDSFNTSDDKTINAPSIHAVEQNYKLKGDFAVIDGTMELEANTSERALEGLTTRTSTSIDFPTGFNADNCVLISAGRYGSADGMISYGWSEKIDAMDMYNSIEPFKVSLNKTNVTPYSEKIKIEAGNLSTNLRTLHYKIVLMKVS